MEKQKPKKNAVALVGFIISFFFAIAGLALSIIGAVNAKRCNDHWKGFAIAGIAVSIVKLIFSIIITIMFISLINLAVNISEGNYPKFIKCLDAEKCTENADGTYSCFYKGEKITCDFDINNIDEYPEEDHGDVPIDTNEDNIIIEDEEVRVETAEEQIYNESI